MTIEYAFKVNVTLVVRMFFDHNYSIEDICLRLRYTTEAVETVIERHKLKNGKSGNN